MSFFDFIDSLPAEKKAQFNDFQDILKDFADILKRDQQDQSLNYYQFCCINDSINNSEQDIFFDQQIPANKDLFDAYLKDLTDSFNDEQLAAFKDFQDKFWKDFSDFFQKDFADFYADKQDFKLPNFGDILNFDKKVI